MAELNKFEGLEEVEVDDVNPVKEEEEEKVELKEYEKLLILENNRQVQEKAINLVNYGCFNQKRVKADLYDINALEKLETATKFNGRYELYRDFNTKGLLFICPIAEDNKGDDEAKKDVKPYEYDILEIEIMDNETYEEVKKAALNNLPNPYKTLLKVSIVLDIILWVASVVMFFVVFFSYIASDSNFFTSFINGLSQFLGIASFAALMIPLIALLKIKVDKVTK